jgi:hypothetical protein
MKAEKSSAGRDYVHPRLNVEVNAVSGHYVLTGERRMAVAGGEVLYFLGCAVIDTACCGPGGCGYALVAGMIGDYAYRRAEDGRPVSRVAAIRDPALRADLHRRITAETHVSQVLFDS